MYQLDFINYEEKKEKFEKYMLHLKAQRVLNEFFSELAEKKGHIRITTSVEFYYRDFLFSKKMKIDYGYINSYNYVDNKKQKHYVRLFKARIFGVVTTIYILNSTDYKDIACYDNVIERNENLQLDFISSQEKKYKEQFEFLIQNYEKYNKDLQDLLDFKDKFKVFTYEINKQK